ncbi:MAG TPA: DUF3618 domain-containing protein [Jiangellaceae bacterium]
MTTSNRAGPETEPVLPTSRRPVPGSERFERPAPVPREQGNRREQGDKGDEDAKRRTAAEIEADMNTTAQRLSATVDELVFRLSPAQIAKRGANGAKGLVITADGRPRPEVIGALAGALVGAAFLLWRSRRR